jgi:ubiquinone/menaquinone biosynthesis C-methylase UbiE
MTEGTEFWDRVAARYAARDVMDAGAYETTLVRTRHHLSPNAHVLEIGCGTGATALRLSGAVSSYVASDASVGMLEQAELRMARAEAPNLSFLQGRLGDDAIAGAGPFDAVLAFNLLHLLPDLGTGLEQVRGLLKPGGLFISKTIFARGPGLPLAFRAAFLVLPVLQRMGKLPPHFRKLRGAELDAAIIRAGFEVIETGNYPDRPPSRFVVARRTA